MYILHNDDGLILGVISGDKNYGEQLTKVGHQWLYLMVEDNRIFNFDSSSVYVDIEKKNAGVLHPDCLSPKTQFEIQCDKTEIEADGIDEATITGIPTNSTVHISSDSVVHFFGIVDDGEIQINSDKPAEFNVMIAPSQAKYMFGIIKVTAK